VFRGVLELLQFPHGEFQIAFVDDVVAVLPPAQVRLRQKPFKCVDQMARFLRDAEFGVSSSDLRTKSLVR
jgi:hypothetical protein